MTARPSPKRSGSLRGRDGRDPASRFELDRTWVIRGIVLAIVVAALLLVLKVSTMAFGDAARRVERIDPDRPPAPAAPAGRDERVAPRSTAPVPARAG